MDDPENIVELIRKDRMKGAIRLVAEYKDRIVHAAYSLCRDRELAEDLAMCTFESVIDKIGTCRNHEAFFS
jgi:DNA-directed RNA polymerase specialized sigma24 family protein